MSKLSVGDRVILKDPAGWLHPWNKFAQERRLATVTKFSGEGHFMRIQIEFDVKRRGAKPHVGEVYAFDIERAA